MPFPSPGRTDTRGSNPLRPSVPHLTAAISVHIVTVPQPTVPRMANTLNQTQPRLATAAGEIAVLVPCYNEQGTVGQVVDAFQQALPGCQVVVCDNASEDDSADVARRHGAQVLFEPRRGKGYAMRRLFADVEADIYLMVDADLTYPASVAVPMVQQLRHEHCDMVLAARHAPAAEAAWPLGHRCGNWALRQLVHVCFGRGECLDLTTGYRALSRRLVKSFAPWSRGFEIETELTIHTLSLDLSVAQLQAPYAARPPESPSKLHTLRDGTRVLWTIGLLLVDERPLLFFSCLAVLFGLLSCSLGVPLVTEWVATGLVPRLPTALLVVGSGLLSWSSFFCGVLLGSVARGRREVKRLAWLSQAPTGAAAPLRMRGYS